MITKKFVKSKKVCKTTFSLPKEAVVNAKEVALLGEFNSWDLDEAVQMKKQKNGTFEATIELAVGRHYEFRYLIDNTNWENDWVADNYVYVPALNVYNSVVELDNIIEEAPVKKPKSKTVTKRAVKPTKKTTTKKSTPAKKTATKKVASKVKPDDLKKIEGIGPKIAGLLNEAGIKSFEALGKAKITVLKEVLKNAGPRFKMHTPDTWAEQAKLAAKGKWSELTKLQDKLKGGKR